MQSLILQPFVIEYVSRFIEENGSEEALIYLSNSIRDDGGEVRDKVEDLGSLSLQDYGELSTYFTDFTTWYRNAFTYSRFPDIIWELKGDTSWVELSEWRGHHNILADTPVSAIYRMTLIDDYNSVVEYDEVYV